VRSFTASAGHACTAFAAFAAFATDSLLHAGGPLAGTLAGTAAGSQYPFVHPQQSVASEWYDGREDHQQAETREACQQRCTPRQQPTVRPHSQQAPRATMHMISIHN